MTEADWLTGADPTAMLNFLRGRASERKVRLFLVARARLYWDSLPPGEMRQAVEVAERFADGLASDDERHRIMSRLYGMISDRGSVDFAVYLIALHTAYRPGTGRWVTESVKWQGDREPAGERLPGLLREVFGNPFRPTAFDPSWRTPAAIGLAAALYESRDFATLPVLGDMLEEAGCGDGDVLAHCRAGGPHVRGCWVVDAVLGRE